MSGSEAAEGIGISTTDSVSPQPSGDFQTPFRRRPLRTNTGILQVRAYGGPTLSGIRKARGTCAPPVFNPPFPQRFEEKPGDPGSPASPGGKGICRKDGMIPKA